MPRVTVCMSSRLPESYAQKNRFFNCRDQLCVNLDTGELIQPFRSPLDNCSKHTANMSDLAFSILHMAMNLSSRC